MQTHPDAPHAVAADHGPDLVEVEPGVGPGRSAPRSERGRRRFWTWVTRRPIFGVVHSAFIQRRLSPRSVA
jgi:hypothetical protein